MSEIESERNSAHTGVNDSVNEMNKEASDPLGVASCSASLFDRLKDWWNVDGWMIKQGATGIGIGAIIGLVLVKLLLQ